MEFLLEYLPWVAAVVIGMMLLPYVAGPIVIRYILRQSADPTIEEFEMGQPRLPRAVAKHFEEVAEALTAEGFDAVQGLVLPDQTPNVKAFVLLFANRREKDSAIATAMYVDTAEVSRLQTAYVEIVSRYRDGVLVQTNNTSELGAFAPRPNQVTTQFPLVQDIGQLYRLHRLIAREQGGAGKTLRLDDEFHGDAKAYLKAAIVEELEGQLETGYLTRVGDSNFRPTWKGALLMTWSQLWPLKSRRQARRDRRARELIAEMEDQQ